MTVEASRVQCDDTQDYTAVAAHSTGQVVQTPDGKAGVIVKGVSAGDLAAVEKEGVFDVALAASVVVLDGAPLWWDHSANAATPVPPLVAGDRDFYLGTAEGDFAANASTVRVRLNEEPHYEIDFHRDGGDTAVVLTAGTPYIYNRGGSLEAGFSATAEAQKLDWLSKRSFDVDSNWVLEAVFDVVTNADADVADLSIGVANATHASDAEAITEFGLFHLDMGADLNIDFDSDDGTNDVGITDTTVDFAVGTPVHVVIDGRDPSNLGLYINGVQVLDATFDISNASGPLKALFHLEKSSNDSPGVVQLDMLRVRYSEQG